MHKLFLVIPLLAFIALFGFARARADGPVAPDILGPALHAGVFEPREAGPLETTVCGSSHSAPNANELQIVTLTNQLRAQRGLAALSVSPSLEKSADTHSLQMAQTGIFAHDSYGATLARTQSCGSPTQSIDENIAGNGSGDPTATFQQYVNSPEHLSILLDANMVSVGVAFEQGIYNDGSQVWPNFWMNTMTFASTADSGGSPQPTPTPSPTPVAGNPQPPNVSTQVNGLSATFTLSGQAQTPLFFVSYGDGVMAGWQASGTFTHTYANAGTFTVNAWLGDGATGKLSAPRTITVTVAAPQPQNICRSAYYRNGALSQGGTIPCP